MACFLYTGDNSPQAGYSLRHERRGDIDIFGNRLLAQAEADTGPRQIRSEPHRNEHMRRLNRAVLTEQAAPVETARPFRSSAITIASPSMWSK